MLAVLVLFCLEFKKQQNDKKVFPDKESLKQRRKPYKIQHCKYDRISNESSVDNTLFFTFGEYKIIQAFREQVNDNYFFDANGYPNNEKIDSLLNDIDLGLWDEYLCWSFESYQNIKSQNLMTQMITAKLVDGNNNHVSESLPSNSKKKKK